MMVTSPPYADFGLALSAVSRAAMDTLRDLGITLTPDDENGIRNGLLSPVRAAIIRDEYNNARSCGVKSEAVQYELAAKYSITFATIHRLVINQK